LEVRISSSPAVIVVLPIDVTSTSTVEVPVKGVVVWLYVRSVLIPPKSYPIPISPEKSGSNVANPPPRLGANLISLLHQLRLNQQYKCL
tara:strand:- start:2615 stop:2881 length:267 start_codon:yes stop_codon:yes gene_type:complete